MTYASAMNSSLVLRVCLVAVVALVAVVPDVPEEFYPSDHHMHSSNRTGPQEGAPHPEAAPPADDTANEAQGQLDLAGTADDGPRNAP